MQKFLLQGSASLILLLSLSAQPTASTPAASANVLELTPFKVTGTRVNASDTGSATPTDHYDANDLDGSGAFDVGEFLDQLNPSPVGKEQLVLIDGQPTYLDIASLPPEMVESIEVSNYGALPQYGAYANGRVVNIRLKKNYTGGSVTANYSDSFAGGGEQLRSTFSGGITRGKLRMIYSLTVRKQNPLGATERDFSRDQDHRALGGRDLRLLWGYPAVVQSTSGPLNGVADSAGQPTSVVLVPENQNGRALTPADFIPGTLTPPLTAPVAAGQRRFNTADYLTLIAPSQQWGFNLNVNYAPSERIKFSVTGSVARTTSNRFGPPPVTPASSATLVPAAYTPFGQDVQVGLVHTGFGAVEQQSESTNAQLGFNLSGQLARDWKWNTSLGTRWSESAQDATDLSPEKFSTALAATDPALRFNPFGDDPHNAALYPTLTVHRKSASESLATKLDVSASGPILQAPGGPANLVMRASYGDQVQQRNYENARGRPDTETHTHPNTHGFTSTLTVPWHTRQNARPALQRLETELASSYAGRSSTDGSFNERAGLLWAPLKSVLLNANYSIGWQAPARYLAELQPLVTETFIDPRRFPATAADVRVFSRDFNGTVRSRKEEALLGITFDPPAMPGAQISVTYNHEQQSNLASSAYEAQDLIYNELTFPGRVIRAAPSAGDVALGQPGAISMIDTTPTDGGRRAASNLDFSFEYRVPSAKFGQFRFSASALHPLDSSYEVLGGVPFTFENDTDYTPPDWSLRGQLSWNRGSWHASGNLRYSEAVARGALSIAATRDLDLRVGYKFKNDFIGRWGRGLQVSIGLGGVLEGTPPFADTINGYRGGSALGRTYSVTIKLPLDT